jgi:hypothetical protein
MAEELGARYPEFLSLRLFINVLQVEPFLSRSDANLLLKIPCEFKKLYGGTRKCRPPTMHHSLQRRSVSTWGTLSSAILHKERLRNGSNSSAYRDGPKLRNSVHSGPSSSARVRVCMAAAVRDH